MSSHKDRAYPSTSTNLCMWKRKHLSLRVFKIRSSMMKISVGRRTKVRRCMSLSNLRSRKGRGSWIFSIIRICLISRRGAIRKSKGKLVLRKPKLGKRINSTSTWWLVTVIWNLCRIVNSPVKHQILTSLNSQNSRATKNPSKKRTCNKKLSLTWSTNHSDHPRAHRLEAASPSCDKSMWSVGTTSTSWWGRRWKRRALIGRSWLNSKGSRKSTGSGWSRAMVRWAMILKRMIGSKGYRHNTI